MPGNDGRTLTWNNKSIKIVWNKISDNKPDFYAAEIALYQSKGGTDWGEWVCKG